MHVFPQLRKLEEKYQRELAVIGVHSAKFISEKETQNVRKAILRHHIQHPVVNDKDFIVWQMYGIRAWPTLMLIDPQGRVVGKHEGEMPFDPFDNMLKDMLAEYDSKGQMDRGEIKLKEEGEEVVSPLLFPGKVLADEAARRLFISDTNHNRIIVASLDGSVQLVIGNGEAGLKDGTVLEARFNHPQGLAVSGSTLYVADTENHAIRRVDLAGDVVETIVGTGEQATMFHRGGHGPSVPLNSPWDLALCEGVLYIAMAGFHQLWSLGTASKQVRPHAGTGQEGILDGPLASAWLAQPSGITSHERVLYFADSETSSIRTADVSASGRVTTVVGKDLFVFGDWDGVGDRVLLQHPIGVCYHSGLLYVADTYNNKIKTVDPVTRRSTSLLGGDAPGYLDGPAQDARFHEPSGVSVAGGKLYIADTNNHVIRVADLSTLQVSTLDLRGL